MAFHFLCPDGHTLEAEESHVGQPSRCPVCETPFVVPSPSGHADDAPTLITDGPIESATLQIPCPNGHELETPREMLGKYAQCPLCERRFRLLEANSLEHQHQAQLDQERRERKASRFWLNLSVAAVTIVVIGLATLFLFS